MKPRDRATLRRDLLLGFSARMAMGARTRAFGLLRYHVRKRTVPPRFFSELLLHLSLFLGYPAALEGLDVLRTASGRRPNTRSLRLPARSRRPGFRLFERIYAKQSIRVLAYLEDLQNGLSTHILREAYGRIMTRRGLSLQERELVNVVVLLILGHRTQLISHLRGAVLVGVSRPVLIDTLRKAGSLANRDSTRAVQLLDRWAMDVQHPMF